MPGYGHRAGLRLGALGALHASQEIKGQGKQQEVPAQTSWEDVKGLFSVGTGFSGSGLTAQSVMGNHLLGALITTALIWPWTSALSCEMTSMGAGRKEGECFFSWEGELADCMCGGEGRRKR